MTHRQPPDIDEGDVGSVLIGGLLILAAILLSVWMFGVVDGTSQAATDLAETASIADDSNHEGDLTPAP